MQRAFNLLYHGLCWFIGLPLLFLLSVFARLTRRKDKTLKPRLLWAGAPMPSLSTVSHALKQAGYDSVVIVNQINTNNYMGQFDIMLMTDTRLVKGLNTPLYLIRCLRAFIWSLFNRDILHCFFNGGILGHTPLARIENFLWKLSGGKLIIFAYGQDGFIYENLPNQPWATALKQTYPRSVKHDQNFARRIKSMAKSADCIVGCILHTVTLPRVDIWPVLWYPGPKIDTPKDHKNPPHSRHEAGPLKIAHASNHRAIKGTNALITAIKELQDEGLNIHLDIIENVSIQASRVRMARADIIVDQLLMGYAMSALEGLALGKLVISGFDKTPLYRPFYEKSYLNDCPIITARPENIKSIIKQLYHNPESHEALRQKMTAYYEKWHSDKASIALFETIYANLYGHADYDLSKAYMSGGILNPKPEIGKISSS